MKSNILLAGVIGDPISHSKSPLLFRYWFEKLNVQGYYVPLKISKQDLKQGLETLPKIGFAGINVTIPHKEKVLDLAEVVTERAKQIGSANTITFLPNGGFKADNTDGFGFLANMKEHQKSWDPKKCIPLVLGAGGASRSVISSFLNEDVPRIFITNRTQDRAQVLKNYFGASVEIIPWDNKADILNEINLLVNTTALGMTGFNNLNLSLDKLRSKTTVIDLVYNPIETQLLSAAKAKGCKAIGGLGMLLHQATPGFKEWFGIAPTIDNDIKKLFQLT